MNWRGLWTIFLISMGVVVIVAGVLLFTNNLGYTSLNIGRVVGSLMGFVFIIAGVVIVSGYWRQRPEIIRVERAQLPGKVARRTSILGDVYLGRQEWELEDMGVESVIGDVRIDLGQARIAGERAIEILSWIGDVDIFVPRDLAIEADARVTVGSVTLLGEKADGFLRALSFTSPDYESADKKVRLRARVIIGDLSILRGG